MAILKGCLIALLICVFWGTTLFARPPDTLWTRTYGGPDDDDGFSICFHEDGGYVLTGYTESFGAGNSDVYLIKTNHHGDTIWTKTFGGYSDENGRYIIRAADEGYIIVGTTGHYPTNCGMLVLKTNIDGDSVWTRTYGPSAWTVGYMIQQTFDNGYVICGRLGNAEGHYLLKTDLSGDTIWTRIYPVSYNACALAVSPTSDGGYIIAGCSGAGTMETSWNVDIVRTDSEGNHVWTKVYGDRSINIDDAAYAVREVEGGGYIVGGFTMTLGAGGADSWLLRIDSEGDTLWTRTYGSIYDEYCLDVLQTSDGGYIMTGFQEIPDRGKDVYIVRTDQRGDTLWTKTVGGFNDDLGDQILITKNNQYVIVGYTESFGAGGRDVYLIKLASDLTVIHNITDNLPERFFLQNYPNPFNASTIISYDLPKQSAVAIDIYDILGRKVQTLHNGKQPAGSHDVIWNADGFSSGVYFYHLTAGDYIESRQMLLLR